MASNLAAWVNVLQIPKHLPEQQASFDIVRIYVTAIANSSVNEICFYKAKEGQIALQKTNTANINTKSYAFHVSARTAACNDLFRIDLKC